MADEPKDDVGPTPPRQFRLGRPTLEDLDLIAAHLSAANGGRPSRADAVRYAARQVAERLRRSARRKDGGQ